MVQGQYTLQNFRHLGHSFYDGDLLVDVFTLTFRNKSPSMLAGFSQRRLRSFLRQLRGREEVQRLHAALDVEFGSAQKTLDGIIRVLEPRIGLPENYHRTERQEVQAFCNSTNHEPRRVAIGRFKPDIAAENVRFTPRSTLYATNLAGIFNERKQLRCDSCGSTDLGYRRAGSIHLYRELFEDRNRVPMERVQQVIRGVAEMIDPSSYKKNPNGAYHAAKKYVVDRFLPLFPEISEGSRISYREIHRLFEWVVRKNYFLTQVAHFDELTRDAIDLMIEKHIKLPYAVVHARVKERLRTIDKTIEVGWDIRDDEDDVQKILGDVYGFRIVVPPDAKDAYIWKTVKAFRKLGEDLIVQEKDWITKPKKNTYSAYHFKIRFVPSNNSEGNQPFKRGIIYSLQITDHPRDRNNETNPNSEHDTAYKAKKMRLLSRIPFQVKPVVATLLGAEESYVMSLLSVSKAN